jgi:beta-phosphoglucomutase-like phosphatase (HAD superfamily)
MNILLWIDVVQGLTTLCNWIFIAGWFVSAYFFALQLNHLMKTKLYQGVSVKSHWEFFFLNLNSSIWMYLHGEYLTITATMLIALVSLGIVVAYYRIKNRNNISRSEFPYDAVLFDFDGVLVDAQNRIHANAEAQVLAGYNIKVIPEEISKKYAGMSTKKVFFELAPHLDPEILYKEKWVIVRKMLEKDDIIAIPGTFELLELLKENNIPICIASASPRWYLDLLMKRILVSQDGKEYRLKDYFGLHYVSAEEVINPKPAPDVFLKAAEVLNATPNRCLVIGDGYSDVYGALAGNMYAIYLGEYHKDIDLPHVRISLTGNDVFEYVKKLFTKKK